LARKGAVNVGACIIGRLPQPSDEGLSSVAGTFEKDTSRTLTAVVRLSVGKVEYDVQSEIPTAKVKFRIDAIEPVGGADESFVLSSLAGAKEIRTGIAQLDGFDKALGGGEDENPID